MPISIAEFAKGHSEDPIIHRIQSFLESNRDHAYTEEEIMEQLYPGHVAWPGDTIAFGSAMLILAYAQKIELRYITTDSWTKTYFKAK